MNKCSYTHRQWICLNQWPTAHQFRRHITTTDSTRIYSSNYKTCYCQILRGLECAGYGLYTGLTILTFDRRLSSGAANTPVKPQPTIVTLKSSGFTTLQDVTMMNPHPHTPSQRICKTGLDHSREWVCTNHLECSWTHFNHNFLMLILFRRQFHFTFIQNPLHNV